jgi:hypothetical protein
MERQSEENRNKEDSQHEGHRGSDFQSQMKMEMPCGTNGAAQMSTGYISMGRNYTQKGNWATKDPMRRHVQESSRRTVITSSQKPERVELTHTMSVKATSL